MIYGVDIGMRRLALACLPLGVHTSVDLGPGKADRSRHVELMTLVKWFAEQVPPDAVVWIENPLLSGGMARNVHATIGLAETKGALLSIDRPGAMHSVSTMTWKAAVVGHGHASKDDIRAWVESRFPASAEACAGIEDRYDATGVARYGELVSEGWVAGARKVPRRRARKVLRAG
jgi:Holliday junction resolvasome RuvABC endonuclease subunit